MDADERVSAYISKSAPLAQPILTHIRAAVHKVAPDLAEAIKWSMPSFTHKGKLVIHMAAFKEHAALSFWHGELVTGPRTEPKTSMGSLGKLTSLDDLPDDVTLESMIAKAAELARAGVKAPMMENRTARPELDIPEILTEAIAANDAATEVWASFAPGARRDYAEWIGEAKRPETAAKRVAEAVEWIAEGKKRHWKYEKC